MAHDPDATPDLVAAQHALGEAYRADAAELDAQAAAAARRLVTLEEIARCARVAAELADTPDNDYLRREATLSTREVGLVTRQIALLEGEARRAYTQAEACEAKAARYAAERAAHRRA